MLGLDWDHVIAFLAGVAVPLIVLAVKQRREDRHRWSPQRREVYSAVTDAAAAYGEGVQHFTDQLYGLDLIQPIDVAGVHDAGRTLREAVRRGRTLASPVMLERLEGVLWAAGDLAEVLEERKATLTSTPGNTNRWDEPSEITQRWDRADRSFELSEERLSEAIRDELQRGRARPPAAAAIAQGHRLDLPPGPTTPLPVVRWRRRSRKRRRERATPSAPLKWD